MRELECATRRESREMRSMPRSKSACSSSVSFSRVALYAGIPLVAERQAGVVHPAEVVGLVRLR